MYSQNGFGQHTDGVTVSERWIITQSETNKYDMGTLRVLIGISVEITDDEIQTAANRRQVRRLKQGLIGWFNVCQGYIDAAAKQSNWLKQLRMANKNTMHTL